MMDSRYWVVEWMVHVGWCLVDGGVDGICWVVDGRCWVVDGRWWIADVGLWMV